MTAKFEDMVKAISTTTSPFALANDLPVFKDGLTDLMNRLHALEAQAKLADPPKTGGL